jgi:hypothetical protein
MPMMPPAPKIPLPYRLAALAVALMLGLYTLQFYVFGAKFAGAISNYARLSEKQAAAAEAAAHKPPPRPSEPGVVSVQIIGTPAKKN